MNFIRNYIYILTISIIFIFTIYIYGFSSGITGQTKKNGNGCTCHGNFSSSVNVTLNGPETVKPNETVHFTLTISGGPLAAAGTNIAASNGTLVVGEGLQILGGELTHQQPKLPVSGVVTFEFDFTAPSTEGDVTLYANGNSVNLNGANSGDSWNFAPNKIISVKNPTTVESENLFASYELKQNFPNPFNPSTMITYTLKNSEFVELKIFDVLGNEIETIVSEFQNAGSHNYQFSFKNNDIASGIYFVNLSTKNFTDTKKMIFMK